MISSQVIKRIHIDQQGSHNAILQVAITVLLSIAAVSPTAQAQLIPARDLGHLRLTGARGV